MRIYFFPPDSSDLLYDQSCAKEVPSCVPSKPLPEDLESFVNGSGDDGFIIVSFGSILKNADVPDGIRRLFLSTFARDKFSRPADEASALTCGGDEHHLHYDFIYTLSNFVLGLLESWLLVCDFSFSSAFSVGCILLYCACECIFPSFFICLI
jgi:hypothetical protein